MPDDVNRTRGRNNAYFVSATELLNNRVQVLEDTFQRVIRACLEAGVRFDSNVADSLRRRQEYVGYATPSGPTGSFVPVDLSSNIAASGRWLPFDSTQSFQLTRCRVYSQPDPPIADIDAGWPTVPSTFWERL